MALIGSLSSLFGSKENADLKEFFEEEALQFAGGDDSGTLEVGHPFGIYSLLLL